jgi:CDP-4-dehydro-6-deoxyglucose reductase
MSFKVTVLPSGKQFSMQTGESILDAALRTHVVLPYGCRNGACGSCKAQVLSGQVTQGPVQTSALSAAERAEGDRRGEQAAHCWPA